MGDDRPLDGNLQMDIDIDKPIAKSQPNPFLQSVPEGYGDKPWVKELAKNANPLAEMFKQYDNQLSLIGRKNEGLKVPDASASQDEWKAFHKALGVPENLDDYKYEQPQVPEHLKEYFARDDDLLKVMRTAAQKAGVTPAGWKEIVSAFDSYYLGQLDKGVKGAQDQLAKLESDFKQKYGDRSNKVLEQWGKFSEMAPDWAKAALSSVPNEIKVAQAALFDAFASKYIGEGRIDFDVPATGNQMSVTEYGEQFAEAFARLQQSKYGSADWIKAQKELEKLRNTGKEMVFKKA